MEMKRPQKILVPVDLSARSEKAVSYAAMLARNLESTLVLTININSPERTELEEYAAGEGMSVEDAASIQLKQRGRELATGVRIEVVPTMHDFPADGILDTAESERVDMIVIASHGRGGMTRWLLGSVAEKVARSAEVPVVIVPAKDPA
jgi:nucleotide-binding universal stress UspA family protein